jgi:hypothetical protein
MQSGIHRWQFLSLFLVSIAICAGGGYVVAKHADYSWSVDSKSYLQMAKGDYDVTVTHRYRVVVPWLAGSLYSLSSWWMQSVWPEKDTNKLLRFCFFAVNLLFFSFAVACIANAATTLGYSGIVGLLLVLPVCSSRWTVYLIGLPLTDSLYFLSLSCLWIGLASSNPRLLYPALLLGPLAKETFLLFLPLLFLAHLPGKKLIAFTFCLAGVACLIAARWLVNVQYGPPLESDAENILQHVELIRSNVLHLFTLNGLGQVFGTFGLFGLLPFAYFIPAFRMHRHSIRQSLRPYLSLFFGWLLVISIHMLLSGDFSRMFFFTAPPLVWGLALLFKPFLPHADQG